MKVKFTLLTLVLTAAVSSAMAAGSQPGNWCWKKPSAPTTGTLSSSDVLANINTPIVIYTANDVVSLRWQIFSGSLSASHFSSGRVFLQYYDAGATSTNVPPSGVSGSETDNNSRRGVNQESSGSYDRFNNGTSQTMDWFSISDEGTVYNPSTATGAGTQQFVMSSYGTTAQNAEGNTTSGSTSNRLQLSQASYSYTSLSAPQYNGYAVFTKTNGNTSSFSSSSSGRTIIELEFHIKSAYNPSLSGDNRFGLRPGHRYFFRLRGYDNGFQSPSGILSNGVYGDYKASPPYAYLDVDPNFIARTLPVTLTSFNANLNGGKVNLAWATATEIANSGFEILKGINSNNLEQSKFVASKAASNGGNSSTALNYTSIDSFPVNNATNYYQLKQIDLDGNTSYSDKVSVYVTGATTSLTVGPNPAVSVLNVNNLKTGSNLRVINLSGAIVKSQIVNANSVSLDIANLPSGVYIVEVVNLGGIKESHKFVKK